MLVVTGLFGKHNLIIGVFLCLEDNFIIVNFKHLSIMKEWKKKKRGFLLNQASGQIVVEKTVTLVMPKE